MNQLTEQLKQNTRNAIINYDILMDNHYTLLQSKVLELLDHHSKKSKYFYYDVEIGNLYIEDYYNPKCNKTILCETILGGNFRADVGDVPSLDELQDLTSRLEKYLLSQGLSVTYISHCNIRISWN